MLISDYASIWFVKNNGRSISETDPRTSVYFRNKGKHCYGLRVFIIIIMTINVNNDTYPSIYKTM